MTNTADDKLKRQVFDKYAPGVIDKIKASKTVYTEESPEYQMLCAAGYGDFAKSRKKTFGHSGLRSNDGEYSDSED